MQKMLQKREKTFNVYKVEVEKCMTLLSALTGSSNCLTVRKWGETKMQKRGRKDRKRKENRKNMEKQKSK